MSDKKKEASELALQAWDVVTDILQRVENGYFDKEHFDSEATRQMVEAMSYLETVMSMVAPDVLHEDTEDMKALYGAMLDAREKSLRGVIAKAANEFRETGEISIGTYLLGCKEADYAHATLDGEGHHDGIAEALGALEQMLSSGGIRLFVKELPPNDLRGKDLHQWIADESLVSHWTPSTIERILRTRKYGSVDVVQATPEQIAEAEAVQDD